MVKTHKVLRFVEMFGDSLFVKRILESVYYMLLKMGFDGTIELSCIGLTTRTGNLVNSLVDNWVIFVFSTFEKLF